jgi:hypothetical protein
MDNNAIGFNFQMPQGFKDELSKLFLDTAKPVFSNLTKQQEFPRYMTKQQAAEYMHVSVNTLKQYIVEGLSVIQTKHGERIDKLDADKFYSACKV